MKYLKNEMKLHHYGNASSAPKKMTEGKQYDDNWSEFLCQQTSFLGIPTEDIANEVKEQECQIR